MIATSRETRLLWEPTRLALDYALSLLDKNEKLVVLDFLEKKCYLSLYGDIGELSREEVESALWAFFDSGAMMFMERYDTFLIRLQEATDNSCP